MCSHVLFTSLLAASASLAKPLQKRGINDSQLQNLRLYEQWAAATYCPWNNNSTASKITCKSGSCDMVQAADTKSLYEFENTMLTDTTGFVALDNTNKEIVMAFRGSVEPLNYVTDALFGLTNAPFCAGCQAATGFMTAWNEVKMPAMAAIAKASAANPDYKIVSIGHSLGAALATVAAADMRRQGLNVDLITFGGPRVGNRAFADFLTKTDKGINARVTHAKDLIPMVPPEFMGHTHFSPEFWITADSKVGVKSVADVKECDGIENTGCNSKFLLTDGNLDDHVNYFSFVGC